MNVLYKSILGLIFTTAVINPLSSYASLACSVHDSQRCNTVQNFSEENAQGCAAFDGNCRKVFCNQCVVERTDQMDSGDIMKKRMVNTCGFACLYTEVLARFELKQRNMIYDMAGEAYQNLRIEIGHPLTSPEADAVRAGIGSFFETRLIELLKYRSVSTTYPIYKLLGQTWDNTVDSQRKYVAKMGQRAHVAVTNAIDDVQEGEKNRLRRPKKSAESRVSQSPRRPTSEEVLRRAEDTVNMLKPKILSIQKKMPSIVRNKKSLAQNAEPLGIDLGSYQETIAQVKNEMNDTLVNNEGSSVYKQLEALNSQINKLANNLNASKKRWRIP